MATIYATLIIKGHKSFEQVPPTLKEVVKTELQKQGYDTDGKPLKKPEGTPEVSTAK